MQRILLIVLLTILAACAVIGIFLILARPGSWIMRGAYLSLLLIGLVSLLGLASLTVWTRKVYLPLGMVGLAAAPLALGFSFLPIWGPNFSSAQTWSNPWYSSHTVLNLIGIAWIVAVGSPCIGFLGMAKLHRRFVWIRRFAILVVASFGVWLGLLLVAREALGVDADDETLAVWIVVSALGVLTTFILHKFSALKKINFVESIPFGLLSTCPRCSKSQKLPIGQSACSQCGLRFNIEIEENLCEKCGYALYRLESSSCPECGTLILKNLPEPV